MKIGVVVITHGKIAEELIKATETIVKEKILMAPVCVLQSDDTARYQKMIEEAITRVTQKGGVLLLSDMFGGTPSNLCLPFLKKGQVELVTGVNLPMLLKLATVSENLELSQVVQFIKEYGQRNITIANEILKGDS
ncbi:MAG: PTS fructose transporter subunit IIA [bacterium]